jgi:hypothetical protein
LAQPGGNVAGFANFKHSIGGKWFELLKDTAHPWAKWRYLPAWLNYP